MSRRSYKVMSSAASRLSRRYLSELLSSVIRPVDYTRTKEIPAIIDVSGILDKRDRPLRILDIGSPQILALSLCMFSEKWELVYVNPFGPELDDMRKRASVAGIKNLEIVAGDITDPKIVESLGEFDFVFSCSVFEHIHPEHGGDVKASENLRELLKPGGVFTFSVPYYKKAFNEYVEGGIYSVKGARGEKVFFQRFYDEGTLHGQIIKPSGLNIMRWSYIGERFYFENDIHRRMAFFVGVGKRSFLLGRFFNRISDVFMTESQDYKALRKPYLAVYSLVK